MKPVVVIFASLLLLSMQCGHAQAETPTRLPLQVDGPLKISPWRARETISNPNYDHYVYSTPAFYWYCGYGWSWCGMGWCQPGPYGFYPIWYGTP